MRLNMCINQYKKKGTCALNDLLSTCNDTRQDVVKQMETYTLTVLNKSYYHMPVVGKVKN